MAPSLSVSLSLPSFLSLSNLTMSVLHVVYVVFSLYSLRVFFFRSCPAPFFSLIRSVWVCLRQQEPWSLAWQAAAALRSGQAQAGSGGIGCDVSVRGEIPHSWDSPPASPAPAWPIESSWAWRGGAPSISWHPVSFLLFSWASVRHIKMLVSSFLHSPFTSAVLPTSC